MGTKGGPLRRVRATVVPSSAVRRARSAHVPGLTLRPSYPFRLVGGEGGDRDPGEVCPVHLPKLLYQLRSLGSVVSLGTPRLVLVGEDETTETDRSVTPVCIRCVSSLLTRSLLCGLSFSNRDSHPHTASDLDEKVSTSLPSPVNRNRLPDSVRHGQPGPAPPEGRYGGRRHLLGSRTSRT